MHPLKTILVTVLLLTLCLTAGCGRSSRSAANDPTGNTLTFASPDCTTINPVLNTHDELPDIIFSGLMKYDAAGNPVPDLAESCSYDENSLTYTFKLRPGIKWQDGEDFSAEDVKFTFDRLTQDKTLSAAITDNYKDIAETTITAPDTVQIRLTKPNTAMPDYLTIGILPRHLLEGKDIMTAAFNQHPIGTGRYKFVSWEPGQSIIVEKNPDYYGKIPEIAKIIFKIIPDENARALQIKSGELDIAWLNAQNADTFRADSSFTVYDFKTADYRAIAPNFSTPFWQANKSLAGILSDALDKQAIIDSTLQGHGFIAYSPIQLNPVYNNEKVEQHHYDPQKFQQEVEALGWHKGTDDIYEKDGQKLSFSVDVRENEEERIAMAQIAAQQFKDAGVDMKVHIVQKLDWKSLESFLIGEAAPFDPDNGTYTLFVTHASGNYTHYSNPEVDTLLQQARSTTDPQQRKKAYDAFQTVWAKDPAYIMIAYLNGSYVSTPRLHGLDTSHVLGHHAVGVMWNIEEWTLDKK